MSKADCYTVCKVKPRSIVIMPQTNLTEQMPDQAFQDEAVKVLQIDKEVEGEQIRP